MPFKLSPRLKTFDYLGLHRYFLTICTHERRPVFLDRDRVNLVREQLRRTSDAERFAIIAYCFMPDHLHVLAEGVADPADFTRFVRLFKQRSSFHWKRATGTKLSQRSYFERVLRTDEDSVAVARYLIGNPVRARLVASPDDYPFLGSLTMSLRELLESAQVGGG